MSGRIVLVLQRRISIGRARIALRCLAGALTLMALTAGCARRSAARLPSVPPKIGSTETGIASWYGVPYDGRPAASGEVFDMEKLTAAHRALPFDTWVEITNLSNGKQVDVRITDRGPFVRGRIVDLSLAAARQIDMVRAGTARVRLKVIDAPVTIPAVPAVTAVTAEAPPITAHPAKALVTAPERAGDYAVQVGAFVDPSRAEALRANLPYSDARVVQPGDRQGSPPLWRVWVGHALTLPEATALAADVQKTTGAAIVVRENATQ
jgi:rare lipoprotein A